MCADYVAAVKGVRAMLQSMELEGVSQPLFETLARDFIAACEQELGPTPRKPAECMLAGVAQQFRKSEAGERLSQDYLMETVIRMHMSCIVMQLLSQCAQAVQSTFQGCQDLLPQPPK